jgi:hypothetical protein
METLSQNNRYDKENELENLYSKIQNSKDKFKKRFIQFYSSNSNKEFMKNIMIYFSIMYNILISEQFWYYINNSNTRSFNSLKTRSQKFMELLNNFDILKGLYIAKRDKFNDVYKENIDSLITDILKLKKLNGRIYNIFKSLLANYVNFFLKLSKEDYAILEKIDEYFTVYTDLYDLFKKYCRVDDQYNKQKRNNKGYLYSELTNSEHLKSYRQMVAHYNSLKK